jgi:predicted RNA-binding Zn ribbon-like protein
LLSGEAAPAEADLALLQQAYAAAMAHAVLVPGGARWTWRLTGDDLDRAWWPAARSAVDLLTSGPVERVKVCASRDGCSGLFLDTSKNRSRRWCSMETCGAEAKVTRLTARRRARG